MAEKWHTRPLNEEGYKRALAELGPAPPPTPVKTRRRAPADLPELPEADEEVVTEVRPK
jgi:hypothetical protein